MCNKTGEATNINNEILQRQRLRQKHLIGITGDTFTADIKYHPNCLSNYLLKFKQEVELIVNDEHDLIKKLIKCSEIL